MRATPEEHALLQGLGQPGGAAMQHNAALLERLRRFGLAGLAGHLMKPQASSTLP